MPTRSFGPAVLCLDDEMSVLRLLMDTLGAAGYRVLIAQSADRALNILRRVSLEAVVIDHQMPSMDGFVLAQNIKHINENIPVVVFTSLAPDIPPGLRELASSVVAKGTPLENLTAALGEAIAQRGVFHGAREHLRYHVELRVLVTARVKLKADVFWIKARSLGEGGLGADLPKPLKEGDIVLLDLALQDQNLSLPASVRYHAGTFHGFQFLDISHEQRSAIRDYCEALF